MRRLENGTVCFIASAAFVLTPRLSMARRNRKTRSTEQFGPVAVICLMALLLGPPCTTAQTTSTSGAANRETPEPLAAPGRADYKVYVPITEKERLHYYFSHLFSPEAFLRSAAGAGINQAMNTPSEWGQGAAGYGRRFASSFGAYMVQATVMYGTSAALHEDNRYFQSGESGAGARLKYAILSTFMARHDDGSRHFSWSRIISYGAAAGISRAWQPPSNRGAINVVDAFAISVGAEAGFNVAREFLPGIFHSRAPVMVSLSPAH